MSGKHIAIVGAGPKAAAIAAKADILNRVQKPQLQVTIFEQSAVAANWSGRYGYTDGEARLCTPAERDLGFPYDAGVFDPRIAAAMYAEYSWGAYLLEHVRADAQSGFNNWVNRGRSPPTHAEFAGYVEWAIAKSSATLEIGTVTRLEPTPHGWRIHRRGPGGRSRSQGLFDGVVFTGPGAPLHRVERLGTSARITDGRDFWKDPDGFLAQPTASDEPVIILGAGGTAAAIAARTVRARPPRDILIIGDQAALFTRSEAFFESQIFTDDAIWERLEPNTRRGFTDRLNRGVVWSTISDELARSPKVRFEPGRGEKIEVRTGLAGEEILVEYRRSGKTIGTYASLAIDASGFDTWWFATLLPPAMRDRLTAANAKKQKAMREAVADGMSKYLELFNEAPGPIHAPMLSQAVGPGFMSLMALGAMSDRILDRYLPSYIAS
ncbi:SidA/IucD/PvdA family monooxygenase [Flavisphingomonas formosensis]|uniref:SidA/IucD/PvdA family monooxygenase n=1 Tax=Flavisphingomonas formosensis TaxID=861534 RepID=UPI0012FB801A|nr:SidA/IucD/PvdA family monooxygenase [Sphingomonas formosensis]